MPDSAQLHDTLARIYSASGSPARALPHARRAVELNPQWADFHAHIGATLLSVRDLPGAVEAFEEAVALDDDHAGAHLGAMWRAKLGGTVDAAAAHAERALALGAERPAVWEALGEVWEGVGEYDRAIDVYETGLALHPERQDRFHMRLAIQWARLGEPERSEAHRLNAGSVAGDRRLRARLGIAYAAGQDFGAAERTFRALLDDHPDHLAARVYLARVLRESGREDEAAQMLEGLQGAVPLPPAPSTDAMIGEAARG